MSVNGDGGNRDGSARLYCVLRYDDYGADANALDESLIDRIERYAIPHTFGVIPESVADREVSGDQPVRPLTADSAAAGALRRRSVANLVEPALHGWSHEHRVPAGERRKSEFRGLSAAEQTRRIRSGKNRLEEVFERTVGTFIPPYNTYDAATVMACESAGLRVFSASLQSFCGDVVSPSMRFIPKSCELRYASDALARWPGVARLVDGPTVMVIVYHRFEIEESGDRRAYYPLRKLEMLFRQMRETPGVQLVTLEQAARELPEAFDGLRYRDGHWSDTYRRTNNSVQARCALYDAPPPHFYYTAADYARQRTALDRRARTWPFWLLSASGWRVIRGLARRRGGGPSTTGSGGRSWPGAGRREAS